MAFATSNILRITELRCFYFTNNLSSGGLVIERGPAKLGKLAMTDPRSRGTHGVGELARARDIRYDLPLIRELPVERKRI